LAPSQFGQPDAIADFYAELVQAYRMEKDKEQNKILYKKSLEFKPKTQIYVPVLVRTKESEGVKFWPLSMGVYKTLLELDDPEIYEKGLYDMKQGHDIQLIYTPADQSDTDYPKYSLIVLPKSSPVSNDKDVVESIKAMPDVVKMFDVPDYDETKRLLESYLKNEKKAPAKQEEVKKETNADFLAEMNKTSKPSADVDAELASMFEDEE
jgi:hypothetical protein